MLQDASGESRGAIRDYPATVGGIPGSDTGKSRNGQALRNPATEVNETYSLSQQTLRHFSRAVETLNKRGILINPAARSNDGEGEPQSATEPRLGRIFGALGGLEPQCVTEPRLGHIFGAPGGLEPETTTEPSRFPTLGGWSPKQPRNYRRLEPPECHETAVASHFQSARRLEPQTAKEPTHSRGLGGWSSDLPRNQHIFQHSAVRAPQVPRSRSSFEHWVVGPPNCHGTITFSSTRRLEPQSAKETTHFRALGGWSPRVPQDHRILEHSAVGAPNCHGTA